MGQRFYEDYHVPWWDARQWSRKTWLIVGVSVTVALVIIIPVAVVESRKASAYPNYTQVNYTLADTYSDTSFFDSFNYYSDSDPADGFVQYVSESTAEQLNLTYASSTSAVLRVDTSMDGENAANGRYSVRVTSKLQYDNGLFLLDVKHTPYGCGTWPALWLSDPDNWPENGEIDIMEAVNQGTSGNAVTLHTTGGCTMKSVKREMIGTATQADCHNTTNSNAGCGVDGNSTTYGSVFNKAGGGILAVEWRDEGIRVWQFVSDVVPDDITNGTPDPSTWGTALADFPDTKCSIGSHFQNASIIANIDFCGGLGEAYYPTSGCPKNCVGTHTCLGGTSPTNCTDYVANNPTAFENAYWEFGEFKIYQKS